TKGRKERDGLGPLCDSPEIVDGSRTTEVENKGALLRQNGKRQKDTPISEETSEEERRAESITGRIVDGECKRNSGVDEEIQRDVKESPLVGWHRRARHGTIETIGYPAQKK